jgi:NAD(P)-dependent dehydrogenase (short-subunit alcohol dehydrogenase family)
MKLQGKVAIITGSGRGLGRASALAMAREGASMVILSRTRPELKKTESDIRSAGGEVLAIRTDVSKPGDITAVVRKAFKRFGKIDILMNNAGIVGPVKPLHTVKIKEWDLTMDIDLRAAFLFSRAVAPSMIEQRQGKIINVTSGLGRTVMPRSGVYFIAKAGLDHLTRVLAVELEEYNIQVNGLDPGVMDTRMQEEVREPGPEAWGEETYRDFVMMKESGRLKPPERVARLAVFLASDESNVITGEIGTENHYRQFGYQ